MKQLLVLMVLVLSGGILAGLWMLEDPGYVLVIRDGTQLETSFGFAIFALIVGAALVSIVTLLLATVWDVLSPFGAGGRWRNYLARQRMQSGFQALVEGRWKKAERLLAAAAGAPQWRVMASLGAAQAAAEQGEDDRVHAYLEYAQKEKRGRLAAGLLSASIALQKGYAGEARNELKVLRDLAPRNPRLTRLLADALERMEDWEELVKLLPALSQSVQDAKALRRRERRAWHGWMKQRAESLASQSSKERLDGVRAVWKKMPGELQQDASLCTQYAGYLAQLGDGEAALSLVRKAVERQWDDRMASTLESIDNVAPERLLAQIDHWLEERPGNSVLLLTAGRVALKAQLWGKARTCFDAAGHAGNATALAELARLSAALGDNQKALAVLEDRLRLIDAHLPELPMPARKALTE